MSEQLFLGVPRPSNPVAVALEACRRHFLGIALFSALMNLLIIVPMLYMLQIYDRVVPTRGLTTLFFITLVLLFALATSAILDLVRTRLLVRASIRLDRLLAGPTLETALMQQAGSTQGRQAMREFDTLRQTLAGPALVALCDLPWSPLFVLICFLIHPGAGPAGDGRRRGSGCGDAAQPARDDPSPEGGERSRREILCEAGRNPAPRRYRQGAWHAPGNGWTKCGRSPVDDPASIGGWVSPAAATSP